MQITRHVKGAGDTAGRAPMVARTVNEAGEVEVAEGEQAWDPAKGWPEQGLPGQLAPGARVAPSTVPAEDLTDEITSSEDPDNPGEYILYAKEPVNVTKEDGTVEETEQDVAIGRFKDGVVQQLAPGYAVHAGTPAEQVQELFPARAGSEGKPATRSHKKKKNSEE